MSANTALVLSSLALGVLLVAVARGTSRGGQTTIDFPQWDFSKSWASNLTVVGAILGTVLSAKILPAHTVVVTPDGYTALSLLFGILVVIAPFLYTAFRTGKATPTGPEFEGRNSVFLVASAVTIWAVCGEIATIGLVLYEAQHAKALALGAVIPMLGALGAALALTCVYSVQSIRLMLESEQPEPAGKPEHVLGLEAPVARWTLL